MPDYKIINGEPIEIPKEEPIAPIESVLTPKTIAERKLANELKELEEKLEDKLSPPKTAVEKKLAAELKALEEKLENASKLEVDLEGDVRKIIKDEIEQDEPDRPEVDDDYGKPKPKQKRRN